MSNKTFGIGIIGCGLIGQKRAKSLGEGGRLVACADIDKKRAKSLADTTNATAFDDWQELLKLPEVELVVVATLHDSLAEITLAAIEAGKHILVEKPAAQNTTELEPVIVAAKKKGVKVHVGFNHRYHRSLRKAKEIIDSSELGELMFIRARYGHGGRFIFSVPHPFFAFLHEEQPPFYFRRNGADYFSGRNQLFEGRIWRRDGTNIPVRCVHKTFDDYFNSLAAAGFTSLPVIRELYAQPQHLKMDPDFFEPLKNKPLHLAFRIMR